MQAAEWKQDTEAIKVFIESLPQDVRGMELTSAVYAKFLLQRAKKRGVKSGEPALQLVARLSNAIGDDVLLPALNAMFSSASFIALSSPAEIKESEFSKLRFIPSIGKAKGMALERQLYAVHAFPLPACGAEAGHAPGDVGAEADADPRIQGPVQPADVTVSMKVINEMVLPAIMCGQGSTLLSSFSEQIFFLLCLLQTGQKGKGKEGKIFNGFAWLCRRGR